MTTAMGLPRRGALRTVLLAVMIVVAVASTNAVATPAPAARIQVIVRALPGAGAEARQTIERAGGSVGRQLGLISGFVAQVPEAGISGLAGAAGVRSVTPDPRIHLLGTADRSSGSSDPGSMLRTAWTMGLQAFWGAGLTGKGVDVAVIDSGVAPVQGLTVPGKVVNGPDLSFDSQSDSTRYVDGYGHGTHVAGIIAGRDGTVRSRQTANDQSQDAFVGMAPDARLVNVKVADSTGATDVSQVIAAIDWVIQHRQDGGLNIRVLNLSFGTDGSQAYQDDPLAFAAEMAWRKGIVVVVAAGNQGSQLGHLMDPAVDPYVLAVGADDSKGTPDVRDDAIPDFSSWGGGRNPDIVAPGRSLVSLRDPGSWIDQNHPEGLVSTRFFRGSGTSQAAAAVSGAVANLIQQRPAISPDQVKALLASTATALPGVDPRAQGAGLVNMQAAYSAPTPAAVQTWPLSDGGGSLELARGSLHLSRDGVTLSGEQDIFGQAFDASALAAAVASDSSWAGGIWNGSSWSGSSWSGSSWSGSSWSGSSWSGSSWSGSSWSSNQWGGPPRSKTTCSGKACSEDKGSNTKWGA